MQRTRLLLVDDHPLFRAGLRLLLMAPPLDAEVLEAGSIMDAVHRHGAAAVDVIVLDIHLPGLNGLDGVAVLRRCFDAARILIVSGRAAQAQAAAVPGVAGFVSKSATATQIEDAIALCLQGAAEHAPAQTSPARRPLTPRQLEVLDQLARGHSNKAIAHRLGMAENTVRVHVAAILAYLDVYSRTEAVLEALRRGLVGQMP